MIDLNELRRLEKAATPGPWDTSACIFPLYNDYEQSPDKTWRSAGPVVVDGIQAGYDMKFIVALRNALPALLDRLEKLEAVAEAARSVLSEDEARGYVSCYSMGIALIERLAALDPDEGESPAQPKPGEQNP